MSLTETRLQEVQDQFPPTPWAEALRDPELLGKVIQDVLRLVANSRGGPGQRPGISENTDTSAFRALFSCLDGHPARAEQQSAAPTRA